MEDQNPVKISSTEKAQMVAPPFLSREKCMKSPLSGKTEDVPDITNKVETETQDGVEYDEYGEQHNTKKAARSIGNNGARHKMTIGVSLLELMKSMRKKESGTSETLEKVMKMTTKRRGNSQKSKPSSDPKGM